MNMSGFLVVINYKIASHGLLTIKYIENKTVLYYLA